MDPASITGLTAAIQQLLSCVYKLYTYGESVHEAKNEINQLCSELLALKAALEHVQLNLELSRSAELDLSGNVQSMLSSSNFATPEFEDMISSTESVIKELLTRLEVKPGRFRSSVQRLAWPLVRNNEVKRYLDRLDSAKKWFILATTSDNTYMHTHHNTSISLTRHVKCAL